MYMYNELEDYCEIRKFELSMNLNVNDSEGILLKRLGLCNIYLMLLIFFAQLTLF